MSLESKGFAEMIRHTADRLENIVPSGIRKINERALELEREGKKVLHFELGMPDFDTPEYIKEEACRSIWAGEVFYTSNYGFRELRDTIASYLRSEKDIPARGENILVTTGVAEALFDTMITLLNPGDEILVPDPVWMNYQNIPRLLGARPVTYQLIEKNNFQPDIEEIRNSVTEKTRAIVIVSPNNPTGSILGEKVLEQIAGLAEEKDFWIISDEIYERLVYGVPHTSIASLPGMAERTIVLNGFSKAFSMTGWRIGYAAADAGLIKKMNTVHQINTTSAVSFVQKAAIAALSQENEEVESMRKEYHRRRDYVYQEVNRIQGLHAGLPEGAFYLFINIKELGVPAGEFARILLEEQLTAVVPGTVFGRNGEGHIRLSFAASEEELKEGVSRIKKAAELLHKR